MIKHEGGALTVTHLFAAHFVKGIDRLQVQIVDLGKINLGGYDFVHVSLGLSTIPGQPVEWPQHMQTLRLRARPTGNFNLQSLPEMHHKRRAAQVMFFSRATARKLRRTRISMRFTSG